MTKIALIGGSVVGNLLTDTEKINIDTPYGEMSSPIEIGKIGGVDVAVLYRHGRPHRIPPHGINYRANIYGLKQLGIERVIGVSAVGSLQKHIEPGTIVIPDQFFDYTKGRKYTFFDGPQVVHISMADPFCPDLTDVFHKSLLDLKMKSLKGGTYICIEGPRFSTRAESRFFRSVGDVIGMTLVPEINLARESEMCYLTLATVTDYDVWADNPVSSTEVIRVMKENEGNISNLLERAIPRIKETRSCGCGLSLKEAGL
ncbi:MAG: S-methyl-5'-thioadenosine phosphorylase [Candidatus Thermoplasmatota archaeon]|jgi:5'-methylthioadenosine phosphorylase|nr:S-methyl-5'-thioadenosine phosphorylase [Candidatus Thermoplasmatota archaeon]